MNRKLCQMQYQGETSRIYQFYCYKKTDERLNSS